MTWFYRHFSRFTNSTEADVYKFLHRAHLRPAAFVKPQATAYLQGDTACVMLMLEWKFKGYKHLTKSYRRQCYQNLAALKLDFTDFASRYPTKNGEEYLSVINKYLHQGRIEYRAGSSFDKLCRDPKKKKLVGDCNQLVALYVYLFSLRYDIAKLKLKLLPEHVCLHYREKDYETTSGHITRYKKFDRLAPITELVSINLLDESDKAAQHKLPPENQLLCAQLASVFTGDVSVAKHNIKVSQQALLMQALENQNWRIAHRYARILGLKKWRVLVHEQQGFAALKKQNFTRARTLFARAGSSRGKTAVDQAELVVLVRKLSGYKTLAQLRARKTLIRQTLKLAKAVKRPKVKKWCEDLLRQL